MQDLPRRRALLSVSDKSGVASLARRLVAMNWELVASRGTGTELAASGVPFTSVDTITRNPEAFDGRMKTISFEIESALLYDRRNEDHVAQAQALGIFPIDMVVCNFYPFGRVLENPDWILDDAVEQIDVGGPTMVRAAAKNLASVVVLHDPHDYAAVLEEMEDSCGFPGIDTRRRLAASAFARLSAYDHEIAAALASSGPTPEVGPVEHRTLGLVEAQALRYGENPHQDGRYFRVLDSTDDALALHRFEQLQGKPLSYNNLLDADAVLSGLCLMSTDRPAACIVKHTNPCGAAIADSSRDAFLRAWDGDPLAAFGGIIGVNREVDAEVAQTMLADRRFFEVLVAPGLTPRAREIFAARKNLRVLVNPALRHPTLPVAWEYRSVRGGMLAQEVDRSAISEADLDVVTDVRPTEAQVRDLLLAWSVCRTSRSNAISLVRDQALVGNGVGQQDRVRSCRLAVEKAGPRAVGAAAASDAFFPFADGPEVLADAGVAAIIQPAGSVRDAETLDVCNKRGICMVTTRGVRCFRH